jgi:hypothetical protein
MALSFSPDVVIVCYPTNNYNTYSIAEIMTCLQTMKDVANAQGKVCYITTSQPRQDGSFPDFAARQKLKVIRDSIMNRFLQFAIDFFTPLADPVTFNILPQYLYPNAIVPDNIHVNDAGHRALFEQVRAKNIFNLALPVRLTEFSVEPLNKTVYTSWKVMDETPGVKYVLERSKDAVHFENVFSAKSHVSKSLNTYKFIDDPGATGVYFYRLMIDDNGSKNSSATKKVTINSQFSIKNVVATRSKLRMTLGFDEAQQIDIRLINALGATVQLQKKTLNAGLTDLQVPIDALPPGVYWFEIRGNTTRHIQNFLKK